MIQNCVCDPVSKNITKKKFKEILCKENQSIKWKGYGIVFETPFPKTSFWNDALWRSVSNMLKTIFNFFKIFFKHAFWGFEKQATPKIEKWKWMTKNETQNKNLFWKKIPIVTIYVIIHSIHLFSLCCTVSL